MPLFILCSMILHALLFLYGPQLAAGLIPGVQPGDQGGLMYVTLVETAAVERPRAAVADSARLPQSTPEPRPRPEPAPQPERAQTEQAASANTQAPQPQPQPVETPTVSARPVVSERPPVQEERVAVNTEVTRQPVAPEPVEVTAPTPTPRPEPVQEVQAVAQEPVLTSDRGVDVVASIGSTPAVQEAPRAEAESVAASLSTPVQAEEEEAVEVAAEEFPEGGTGARENVSSAAPDAEIAPEPALPPTGISMANVQGSIVYPKQAVDFLRRTVTVQIAAVIAASGEVIEVLVIDSSGIGPVDEHAMDLARMGITYKPYDSTYELRVHVTYNHEERKIDYRLGEFITSPPTVGSFASS